MSNNTIVTPITTWPELWASDREVLNRNEVATLLGVDARTVTAAVDAGKLPGPRIGPGHLIPRRTLLENLGNPRARSITRRECAEAALASSDSAEGTRWKCQWREPVDLGRPERGEQQPESELEAAVLVGKITLYEGGGYKRAGTSPPRSTSPATPRGIERKGHTMFEVHPSDERDSGWEVSDPRFRVYFFGPGVDSFSSETQDLTGCDVLQAAEWAAANAHGRRFAMALVDDPPDVRPQGRGLRWILGTDANDSPTTAWSAEALARMERGYPTS